MVWSNTFTPVKRLIDPAHHQHRTSFANVVLASHKERQSFLEFVSSAPVSADVLVRDWEAALDDAEHAPGSAERHNAEMIHGMAASADTRRQPNPKTSAPKIGPDETAPMRLAMPSPQMA